MKKNQLYIDGEWTDSTGKETVDVINPATEESIATVVVGTEEDIDKAVLAGNEAFPQWNSTPVNERIEYVEKIYEGIGKYQQKIADTIVAELGSSQTFSEN